MNNSALIVRSLVVYGICLPVAIFLGYSLATPDDQGTVTFLGIVLTVLVLPLLLRWHHAVLIFAWNMNLAFFFLPGQPPVWMVMAGVGTMIALFQFLLNRNMKLLPASSVILPLAFLLVVILVTAWMTGGIGLRSAGSGTYGGKRYFLLFGAILGFVAMISRPVALKHARWMAAGYFLSGVAIVVPLIATAISPSSDLIYLLFPDQANQASVTASESSFLTADYIGRLSSLAFAGEAVIFALLACVSIRRLFQLRNSGLLTLLVATAFMSLFGGFRSVVIIIALTFALVFCLEGLLRTRLLPLLVVTAIFFAAVLVPFTRQMPLSVQRALSFLPVEVDPVAAADARVSTEWRMQMWKYLLPEISQHLMLGKGYSINGQELELMRTSTYKSTDNGIESAMLAGDYHNGPLSTVIPLGGAGVIGFVWFLGAALLALYRNYAHGDAALKQVNTFLFAHFIAKTIFFFGIYGSFYADFAGFTGLVGLSICLNGGIHRPVPAPPRPAVSSKFKLVRVAH